MGNIFAASEVVEIGIEIEKNGRDFYNASTKQAKNAKVKEIFQHLAEEEEKHIVVFEKILNSIEKYTLPESYSPEYFAYLNALAAQSVFTQAQKGKEIAKGVKSDKEAIDIGIGAEKDSLVFYAGIKKVVPQYQQKIVDEVINQEEGHLKQLLDLKAKI